MLAAGLHQLWLQHLEPPCSYCRTTKLKLSHLPHLSQARGKWVSGKSLFSHWEFCPVKLGSVSPVLICGVSLHPTPLSTAVEISVEVPRLKCCQTPLISFYKQALHAGEAVLWFSLAFQRCLTLQWKITSGSYHKGCVKLFWKLLTNYYSVIHWLSFGTYWIRICKMFHKYSSSLCIHAWGRSCERFKRDSQVTPSWERRQYWREGLELKKYADSLGKKSEKAG